MRRLVKCINSQIDQKCGNKSQFRRGRLGHRRITTVTLIAEAVKGLVRRHKNVAAPANILAVDCPAAVVSHRWYVLAGHLDLLQAASHIERLTFGKKQTEQIQTVWRPKPDPSPAESLPS